MTETLNIERTADLVAWLRGRGRLAANGPVECAVLAGGVSNRTVRVTQADRSLVVKQALARLRVKDDWFADPRRVHREALGLRRLAELTPPGSVPRFVDEDHEHHLLVMEAVPEPHENWKVRLLREGPDPDHVRQFGRLLGTLHARSRAEAGELREVFGDRSFFESLRLEPYYRRAAERQPRARGFIDELIAETRGIQETLVHGDYSPKNVLVHDGRLVLLDHEVIHFGDPTFDLGFSLTHFFGKALHRPAQRERFLEAVGVYWEEYSAAAGSPAKADGLEARAVRHTLACLLARVDGRSPLEYLDETERAVQRQVVLDLIPCPPPDIPGLARAVGERLAG
ncbi:MAG: aminoglycoside phosphotransferase family protein [Verrucomicrobiales bacterium]|nr:aminoglycoside phosphotransferase family protein [Verrucomicrobiales bacterium]MCP5525593.1 aminoglycoside phosphotransferase family protein [Verrucomicrobiales bacterium]